MFVTLLVRLSTNNVFLFLKLCNSKILIQGLVLDPSAIANIVLSAETVKAEMPSPCSGTGINFCELVSTS
jgi:hypothetical protein